MDQDQDQMSEQAQDQDDLTAPASAIPSKRVSETRTLRECWSAFKKHSSPRVIAVGLLIAIVARIVIGQWNWRDAVLVVVVLVSTPMIEWCIHVLILHSKPLKVVGRTFDIPSAPEHRLHHGSPAQLDWVLVPSKVLVVFLPMIVGLVAGMSWLVHLVVGGSLLAQSSTALVTAYVVLAWYEWMHFLIHSPYKPKGRYYKSIWRNHRLHHYKNEHYWFGVTSTFGDKLVGTAPNQKDVAKSPTARALHADD